MYLMSSTKTFAIIGAASLALVTAAKAADLPPPSLSLPPSIQKAPALVDELSSGWYLRGDIAYRMNRLGSVTNLVGPQPTSNKIDRSGAIGVGVGYKMNWFRADVTVDYGFKTKYWGDTVFLSPDFTARVDSITALFNVYGDLGTWFGITPYIGVGIGGSNLGTSNFSEASLPAVPEPTRNARWNTAWAWMAGLSYNVSENLAIDLGYRRINMGDALTNPDFFGNRLTFGKFSADEIRAGLRWSL
jgi:opacity protein-like surface antigen